MRASPCKWLERDGEGRPRCEHGWAYGKGGRQWRCPRKAVENQRRYRQTEKGRETAARYDARPETQSIKALHELTRVRGPR